MVTCTNCGAQAPDGTKFCTGCGAPLAPPEQQSQTPPEQGGYTPPVQGGYTPPVQGSYTPPVQGGYPPVQGGYTPPEQGGYTPPEQGGYTPPQSTAPQGGYQAQPGVAYSPGTKAPMWKKPLSKKTLMIAGGGLLAVVLVIGLIAGLGGRGEPKPAGPAGNAGTVQSGETAEAAALREQWNGTWYGALSVGEATGAFAELSGEYDVYMVVELGDKGKGSFAVYLDGVEAAFAAGGCEAKDTGLYATDGTVAGGAKLNESNWVFLPMRDYPDQYAMSDEIEDGDSLFGYYLYMKKWGGSWQKEVDSNFAIVPPSVGRYHAAVAGGEAPPVGFAPIGYAGSGTASTQGGGSAVPESAPVATDAPETPSGGGEFSGPATLTIEEFYDNTPVDVSFVVPEGGWCYEEYSTMTAYIYNVPAPDDAYSNSPRIQFEVKRNLEKFDFYLADFENLKKIGGRVIGGVEMTGRTYKSVGMEWTEYLGTLPNGLAIGVKISGVDIGAGSEGGAILDSVTFS